MIRNSLAIILGLFTATLIINLGLRIGFDRFSGADLSVFEHWDRLLQTESAQKNNYFFVALLLSSGIGSTFGGVVSAIIVTRAKVAYAMLIGFILLFIAMLDVIIFPYHPTFYKVTIFFTYFPFSWIGGKFVEILYQNFLNRRLQSSHHEQDF